MKLRCNIWEISKGLSPQQPENNEKKNIVIAHVREITHVFGEKMDVLFECHANICGQAHVSHNDTHILHITQTSGDRAAHHLE